MSEGDNVIQDIYPKQIDIDFKVRNAKDEDTLIVIDGSSILVKNCNETSVEFPKVSELCEMVIPKKISAIKDEGLMYAFSIDDEYYYLYIGNIKKLKFNSDSKFSFVKRRELYSNYKDVYGFIGNTANHIYEWFTTNQFCGRCGEKMNLKQDARLMQCPSCELVKYPQINPVVIVAIHNKDKILLTKYANSEYDRYALVAGFVEVGESFEEAVKREVMEEVGLKVKNITYFDSQPWGISGGLLAGYYAELDGSDTVKLDLDELKEGSWFTKDEMPKVYENEKSLTRTLMYDWYCRQNDL